MTAGIALGLAGVLAGGGPANGTTTVLSGGTVLSVRTALSRGTVLSGSTPQAQSVTVQPAGTRYTTAGNLLGVSAYSAHDAWAVGYAGQLGTSGVLVLHWDGRAWTRQSSPSSAGELLGVADVSPTSAWAVGGYGTYPYHPWLLHWDGRAWHSATIPVRSPGELTAVIATATYAWAVGVNGAGNPLTLHWTSANPTWTNVAAPTPAPRAGTALDAVAATSGSSAWAVGEASSGLSNFPSLIRWSTGAWRRVSFPISGNYRYVNGLAADAAGLAWGVGADEGDRPGALSMIWNGHSWGAVPVPNSAVSTLYGVAPGPGHNAWAVGQEGAGTLALRWTGVGWAQVRTPNPLNSPILEAVTADAAADAWAVGFGYANASSTAEETLILHWNGTTWG